MSDTVLVALLSSLPPTLVALAGLVASIRNASKINEVHLSLNSRLTELISASHAQGRQDERDAQ